ncbi:hypothetical protein ACIPW5_06060 [Streptomyces sp. NPDC090077]|uniref:hypothetical protein n=1 Tax=Streptomyces sp. NPDC090077 TaxID=3365938 RepID=UPI0037F93223
MTAVLATVQFVVGTTRHTPPVARSAPVVIDTPPAWTAPSPSPSPPSPSPSVEASPSASQKPSPAAPTPVKATSAAPRDERTANAVDCGQGGAGPHTIPAQGGKVTVRYGSRGVCLISAIPGRGFKATTLQTSDDTLTVTFAGPDHQSVVTATITPSAKASVRETSF